MGLLEPIHRLSVDQVSSKIHGLLKMYPTLHQSSGKG